MLKKEHITKVELYSEEWQMLRRGKFTSSRIHCLMGEKGISEGGLTYIDQKLGEEMTGHSITDEDEIEDENTSWGNTYEAHAIQRFHIENKVNFLVTQKLIHASNTRFSSTPDAIWVHGEASNEIEYNVSTLEVKCPRKFHRFNKLFRCKTPHDLYKVDKKYFWQVIDQMDNCDSAKGYFGVYHPLYPESCNWRQIEFRKIDLWDDFKKLKQRKSEAEALLLKFKLEFLNG